VSRSFSIFTVSFISKYFSSKSQTNFWKVFELVAEIENIDLNLSRTIVDLFEDEFTIPFLCRYRKDLIQNLSPNQLRDIKNTIDNVKLIEIKSQNMLKSLEKEKLLTEDISKNIRSVKSLEELENLSALYKPATKGSLFERAQRLGLLPVAENILYGNSEVDLIPIVNPRETGLKTIKEVEEGVKNVMSHLIAKNEKVMDEVRELKTRFGVMISSSQVKQKKKAGDKDDSRPPNAQKFENYFNFSCPASRIKPHQILALNRGESLKVSTFYRFN
jgi:transcriptional accessory protein Tex/SPT6